MLLQVNGKKHRRVPGFFLLPAKAMNIIFRAEFLQALKQLITKEEVIFTDNISSKMLIDLLYQKDWSVYAKALFEGRHAVIEYLGRYTHSSRRIQFLILCFNYSDYPTG